MNLSKQSKQLLSFFTKHKNPDNEPLNNKTKSIITKLYNELIEANQYCEQNVRYTVTTKTIHRSSQIQKPTHFSKDSFPLQVRNHIDKHIKTEYTFTFSLQDRNITVLFMLENENKLSIQTLHKYIESISIWLFILNTYSSKKCVEDLHVYFYFTSLEKTLPTSTIHVLDETNVNTAFTSTCPKDAEIIVFRKEEWFKVFIHETFHTFGLDFSMMDNSAVVAHILNTFKVDSRVNGYEAYTEFWAEIINVLFCAYHLKEPNVLVTFERLIQAERTYSLFQMVKILHFMGLSYEDLHSSNSHSTALREKRYKENTNVLAYYIVKSVLLNNYQGFMQWCSIYNSELIQFKKTKSNLQLFCKFVERNSKSPSMVNNIKYAETTLHAILRKKNHAFIATNLKMALCELA